MERERTNPPPHTNPLIFTLIYFFYDTCHSVWVYLHSLPNWRYAKSKKNKLRSSSNQRQSFIIPWKLQNSWIISYLVWWLFAKAANLNFIVVKWAKKLDHLVIWGRERAKICAEAKSMKKISKANLKVWYIWYVGCMGKASNAERGADLISAGWFIRAKVFFYL